MLVGGCQLLSDTNQVEPFFVKIYVSVFPLFIQDSTMSRKESKWQGKRGMVWKGPKRKHFVSEHCLWGSDWLNLIKMYYTSVLLNTNAICLSVIISQIKPLVVNLKLCQWSIVYLLFSLPFSAFFFCILCLLIHTLKIDQHSCTSR